MASGVAYGMVYSSPASNPLSSGSGRLPDLGSKISLPPCLFLRWAGGVHTGHAAGSFGGGAGSVIW